MVATVKLTGERFELSPRDRGFPEALRSIPDPPKRLYGIGNPGALREGLAVVGARRATPYGRGLAKRFAARAAEKGLVIISGGARGCDAVSHEAALSVQAPTVAFLGGGCDQLYPVENAGLFQRIIHGGGCVVSERDWDFPAVPYSFRARNRLIAGLAKATLIVEAGLPSGTFSTADEALHAGREVWVVPGAITSSNSRGANRLLYQGALPIVDDESFDDALFSTFGCLRASAIVQTDELSTRSASSKLSHDFEQEIASNEIAGDKRGQVLLQALEAEPLGMEALRDLVASFGPDESSMTWLMVWLTKAHSAGLIAQYPDGRYGPRPRTKERMKA